jgi:hypothetical protein
MERIIENVFLNGISLVSKNETPAVEQAENKFALLKTVKKNSDIIDIQLNLNKFNIEKIKQNLKNVL